MVVPVETLIALAQQLQAQDRVPEAIDAYQRVLTRTPGRADRWFNLGVLQRRARQFDAALQSYRRAIDLGIEQPEEAHLNRGVIYSDYLRDHGAAEAELREALRLNPAYVPALLNLANLCEDLGRREEAGQLYRRILEGGARPFEALARYANLQALDSPNDELVSRLRRALAEPAASAAERAGLGFALGRLLDGRREYAAAFAVYSAANRDSRAGAAPDFVPYHPLRQEELVGGLIRSSGPSHLSYPGKHAAQDAFPELAASAAQGISPAPGVDSAQRASPTRGAQDKSYAHRRPSAPCPIFVCGMFRSGSTLAEQLLAAHPSITAGGELDFFPRLAALELVPFPETLSSLSRRRLDGFADRYLRELSAAFPGAVRVTDKRPDNFLYIGLIKTLFPDAKIVHTVRNALDNCLSIFFLHLDHGMSYALDLGHIGHYFRQYHRLMGHWKRLYGADIIDFDYDRFVHEPTSARALFEFLALDWDEGYLDGPMAGTGRTVKTASVWQVRQPLYTHASGRSRHYREQLAGLQRYLADLVAV